MTDLSENVFSSTTTPIPVLRQDLEVLTVMQDGENMLILRDPEGYGEEMIIVRPEAWALFSLFDGQSSIEEIQREVFRVTQVTIAADMLLSVIQSLDTYYFLDNARYQERRDKVDSDFRAMDLRPAAHAGESYPEDPEALRFQLEALLLNSDSQRSPRDPVAVLAPHIDPRIGPQVHAAAYRDLRDRDYDLVVILGPSHYSSEDVFMLTEKDFSTPLGVLRTDKDLVRRLHEATHHVLTKNDAMHRVEHSLEFPAIFLRHLFEDRVPILPILCGSLEDCLHSEIDPLSLDRYRLFTQALRAELANYQRPLILLSVDWSHVGPKFGDEGDTGPLLTQIEKSDLAQLEALVRGDRESFVALLRETRNAHHIDGFSSISAMFDVITVDKGILTAYEQWHEEERQSMVSFAAMSFLGPDA